MGRKICVASGKGGVGKTTAVCGIGLALAKSGYTVCLIDLDVGLNNLDVLMGLENKVIYDLGDCIEGRCRLKQALINDPNNENLYLLPSVRFSSKEISCGDMLKITDKLAGVFDYVLIDSPAGMGRNFELALNSASEVVVVVTPHISSIRDADKVIGVVKGVGINNVGIIVNRIRGDMVARKEMLSHLQIKTLLKTPLIGVIPESDDVNIYSSFKFEKIVKSKVIEAFAILAHNLRSENKIIYDYESKYKGVLGFVRRNLKRSV